MLEAVSQQAVGSSGPREEDQFWKGQCQKSLWPLKQSTSRGISCLGLCDDHISTCASALVVVLDSPLGFLSERKEWVCALAYTLHPGGL